jgi:hypothetical protein
VPMPPVLSARVRRVTRHFAEVVCPPGMRAHREDQQDVAGVPGVEGDAACL